MTEYFADTGLPKRRETRRERVAKALLLYANDPLAAADAAIAAYPYPCVVKERDARRQISLTPDSIEHMRLLWEGSPELGAAEIGDRFGVSKNAVIGHANRRGWIPRKIIPRGSLLQRLDRQLSEVDPCPPR